MRRKFSLDKTDKTDSEQEKEAQAAKAKAEAKLARLAELRYKREATARAGLARWARRLAMASSKIAKYQKQVAYYESLRQKGK